MRICLRLVVISSMLLFPATGLGGQDLEVFEMETFLDPTLLEIELEDDETHYLATLVSQARLGWAREYQYRTDFTDAPLLFAELSTSYVYRRNQVTLRLLGLSGLESDEGLEDEDASRIELQYGRYFVGQDLLGKPIFYRLQVSWSDQSDRREASGTTWGLDLDYALEDVSVVGSLSYAYREPGAIERLVEVMDGEVTAFRRELVDRSAEHYLSYDVRTLLWDPQESFNIDIGMGIGGFHRNGQTKWGTARAELSMQWRPWNKAPFHRFHFVYAPAYQLQTPDRGERFNQEISVFFHAPLGTRIFRRPKTSSSGTAD